jgi:hypothetical protein
MDEPRFNQRPWMYLFFWILVSGVVYFWLGDGLAVILGNRATFLGDVILFVLGILVWLAFFAQFVLPVRIFRDRQKIFDRVLSSMFGGRGPAIFIENGCARERVGEKENRGAGVLWLDSASAAVTRSATKFEKTIGPGVHFTDGGEYLAGTVDLHKQSQTLGPWDSEEEEKNVFAREPDQSADSAKFMAYKQTQKRRLEVSAWTRDGVEVVPNITVVFQIDGEPAPDEKPGSHFVDLNPILINDNARKPEDNPIFRAIVGEAVNPTAATEIARHVAWNQLPARIAVDLWREYLAKFTLAKLFTADENLPEEPFLSSRPMPAETQAVYYPASLGGGGIVTGMLREFNRFLAGLADRCEFSGEKVVQIRPDANRETYVLPSSKEGEKVTALQVIIEMIERRMKHSRVIQLDDQGRPDYSRPLESKEYEILKGRGLRIHSVNISNIRLNPSIEDQLKKQWKAIWLQNAQAEKAQIDRLRSFAEIKAQTDGDMEYAVSIGKSLKEEQPQGLKETIRTLLLRSRNELVKNDRFHRRAGMEREDLEEIIQWVERNGG